MEEPTITCYECKIPIPRSKRITVKTSVWSEKTGDETFDVDICFSCFRNRKMKEIRTNRIIILIFVLCATFNYLIYPNLIQLALTPDSGLDGLPTTPEGYYLISIAFLLFAGFFFLIERRLKRKLTQMKILYEL